MTDLKTPLKEMMEQEQKIHERSMFKKGLGSLYSDPSEATRENVENLANFQGNNMNFAVKRQEMGLAETITRLIKSEKIITLKDLENFVYGGSLTKTVTSASTDVINNIYGRRAWDQVNREFTVFSLLRKVAWSKSGWRVITPETTNNPNYTLEDGSIPEGEDPIFKKLKVTPSSIAKRTTRTDIEDIMARLEDGVDPMEFMKWLDDRHKQIINDQLLSVNEVAHNTIGLWSLDRLIASFAEIAYGTVNNGGAIPANYLDVYGLDRDAAASWADAQVSGNPFGSADRVFALSHINDVLKQIRTISGRYSPQDLVIVTHPETATRMDELCSENQRYNDIMGQTFIRGGRGGMEILGAEPRAGIEGAIQVATWKGIPIFEDPSVVQDVIGRIYVINLNHLFLSVLIPTRFYQWGGPELTSSFNIEMMYRTVMNTVCNKFRAHGKVRDLKIS